MSVPLTEIDTLFTLHFADDQVVVAQNAEDAEYMVRKLVVEYHKRGLEVSIQQVSKTEKLTVSSDQQSIELKDGQEIRGCEQYKRLGVRLISDGNFDQAIKNSEKSESFRRGKIS